MKLLYEYLTWKITQSKVLCTAVPCSAPLLCTHPNVGWADFPAQTCWATLSLHNVLAAGYLFRSFLF